MKKKKNKPPRIEIYTDGAYKHSSGIGGWGVLLQKGKEEKRLSGGKRNTTSNRMELTAAIKGLSALAQKSDVKLYTDSQYVVDGMRKNLVKWLNNNWTRSNGDEVKNIKLWKKLYKVSQKHKIKWYHVKGHDGNYGNEMADKLANLGVSEFEQNEDLDNYETSIENVVTKIMDVIDLYKMGMEKGLSMNMKNHKKIPQATLNKIKKRVIKRIEELF